MKTEPSLRPKVVAVIAPWCGECRALKPTIEAVASRHPDVGFEVIDVSAHPVTASALGIKGTPTLLGCVDGEEIFRATGRRTSAELESMFGAVARGTESPPFGKVDLVLRLAAGAILIVLGFVSGPVWSLVGVGGAVGLFGLLTMRRRRQ